MINDTIFQSGSMSSLHDLICSLLKLIIFKGVRPLEQNLLQYSLVQTFQINKKQRLVIKSYQSG